MPLQENFYLAEAYDTRRFPPYSRPRLYYRLYLREPCDDLTATMCDRDFCNRRILDAVITRPTCPACSVPYPTFDIYSPQVLKRGSTIYFRREIIEVLGTVASILSSIISLLIACARLRVIDHMEFSEILHKSIGPRFFESSPADESSTCLFGLRSTTYFAKNYMYI
ncbi:hypothetical protein M405DRAFT_427100 [Rhizopogon salebrosus TDB-379]|nr:hypothetical protein M405DRAFT_427100 [Rhizopogon salebrosus TDB-379]